MKVKELFYDQLADETVYDAYLRLQDSLERLIALRDEPTPFAVPFPQREL